MYQCFDILVLVFVLEKYVFGFHFGFIDRPLQLHHMRWSVRNDKTVESHRRITKPLFDVLDSLEELYFGIGQSEITDTFRINEGNILLTIGDDPDNEIGMKVACLEESHTSPFAHVSQ